MITLYFLIFPNSEILPSTFKYSQTLPNTLKHLHTLKHFQTSPNVILKSLHTFTSILIVYSQYYIHVILITITYNKIHIIVYANKQTFINIIMHLFLYIISTTIHITHIILYIFMSMLYI